MRTSTSSNSIASRWVLALLLTLAGCGGGGGSSGGGSATTASSPATTPTNPTPGTATASSIGSRVYAYLVDRYYWNDRLPAIGAAGFGPSGFDPTSYASATALLDAVRYQPTDRFSFVTTVGPSNAFFDDGTATGFGIGLLRDAARALFIEYVEPGSPAERAGLLRGQEILAINDITVVQLDVGTGGGFEGQGVGTGTAGVTARFTVRRGTPPTTFVITATSADYRLTTVWAARTLSATEGYLSVKSFITPTSTELRSAFASPAWNTVTDLILDLRYNGGGFVSIGRELASAILGDAYNGQTYASLEYNARNAIYNTRETVRNSRSPSLAIRRVVILATPRTCSAAEQVVVALQSFITVGIIASTPEDGRYTCGKPVGFIPETFQTTAGITRADDPVIYAVNFRSVAANGTTDYYNGLTPTCTQPDTLSQPLAGPGDAMYTSGLARLRTGACPIAVDPRAAPLSIRGAPSAQMPPGLGRVHGNW